MSDSLISPANGCTAREVPITTSRSHCGKSSLARSKNLWKNRQHIVEVVNATTRFAYLVIKMCIPECATYTFRYYCAILGRELCTGPMRPGGPAGMYPYPGYPGDGCSHRSGKDSPKKTISGFTGLWHFVQRHERFLNTAFLKNSTGYSRPQLMQWALSKLP